MTTKQSSIGVVGLGYVGLPLAVTFAEEGANVVGLDASKKRISDITNGISPVEDIPSERLQRANGKLTATTDYQELTDCDTIIVCVPTPLSAHREPDLSALISAGESLSQIIRKGQLISLESTSYPGTTREKLIPILEKSGLTAGKDFNVAFSPERVDPGRTDYTLRNTPKVIGGLTKNCADRAKETYGLVCDHPTVVSSLEVAELSKLLENIFRSVNIALVNELAILCERMNIDIWEVVDAAATKPFGFMRFNPGPGMGGHCLPVDPFYLTWKAREYDFSTEFIELAGKINQQMPHYCVARAERILDSAHKPLKGSKILIVGVAYKASVGDLRESPALKIIGLLKDRGANVHYHDSFVPKLPHFELDNVELSDNFLKDVDLAIIVTAHPDVDFADLATKVPLLLDLRGKTRALDEPGLHQL